MDTRQLRPLDEHGKLRVTRDLTQLEYLLDQLCAVSLSVCVCIHLCDVIHRAHCGGIVGSPPVSHRRCVRGICLFNSLLPLPCRASASVHFLAL